MDFYFTSGTLLVSLSWIRAFYDCDNRDHILINKLNSGFNLFINYIIGFNMNNASLLGNSSYRLMSIITTPHEREYNILWLLALERIYNLGGNYGLMLDILNLLDFHMFLGEGLGKMFSYYFSRILLLCLFFNQLDDDDNVVYIMIGVVNLVEYSRMVLTIV